MTIPGFNANGNLPPGLHRVTLEEIRIHFTWNAKRKRLLGGLIRALKNLAQAGVKKVWIDGSFVTDKNEPVDIDGCWEYHPSVDVDRLDKVFLDLNPPRTSMKKKYGVDFLISTRSLLDGQGKTVLEFFQQDRDGNQKGILLVEIGEQL